MHFFIYATGGKYTRTDRASIYKSNNHPCSMSMDNQILLTSVQEIGIDLFTF